MIFEEYESNNDLAFSEISKDHNVTTIQGKVSRISDQFAIARIFNIINSSKLGYIHKDGIFDEFRQHSSDLRFID